ncbi:ABC-2 transporter permease [Bacillus swezeyi]|uniref:ABC-2 transporter permease n=1 Tax=Bacillus swezeyi TaxID=1925020 RepID=A0A1R1QBE9_9BACI|nr:ABC-2 transporter permease [Bacillus swezeyi]MEC1262598.1 ABC-2 transporter permease [Bacillus swezeyi]MED2929085.1 ABC-2 transporter permease [Bacillus swezeyi]MED2964607.1 ABC-2 transporter permease [Bacillus swezeyi]MED2976712.1 ABC-2 transporter permease [Bacillus swezeyi]MED3072235.1 ABC-2 transporter permease [Bacillus swezeyi]
MYHLIKKDILMQKRAIKLSLLLMIFFTFTFSQLELVGYTVAVLAVTYQLALGASSLEDKNNSDKILISLPIKRNIIVLSKYVSIYVYTAYAILVYFLINMIGNSLHLPLDFPLTFAGAMGAVVAVTLFSSVSFPLIFKYGYLKSKMANLIIFFTFIFGGSAVFKFLDQDENVALNQKLIAFLGKMSNMGSFILLIAGLLIIIICSYGISLSFYKKREF